MQFIYIADFHYKMLAVEYYIIYRLFTGKEKTRKTVRFTQKTSVLVRPIWNNTWK